MIDLFTVSPESIPVDDLVTVTHPSSKTFAPVVVRPAISGVILNDWLSKHRGHVQTWLNDSGAILFRGFSLRGADDFAKAIAAYGATPLEYRERSSPRHIVADRIYTSTDYPAEYAINFHCENSYQASWPLDLYFFCALPSTHGGETPLSDVRKVLEIIPDETRNEFAEKGVLYTRYFGNGLGLGWRDVFQTSDKSAVEAYCATVGINTEWIGDDLRTKAKRPAIRIHPRTGKDVWFNHAFFFHLHSQPAEIRSQLLSAVGHSHLPFHAEFGDGTSIPDSTIDILGDAYNRASWSKPWEQGDWLMIDNMRVAHARTSYKGERSILVAMDNVQSTT